jgi:signal transduction histidine kinase
MLPVLGWSAVVSAGIALGIVAAGPRAPAAAIGAGRVFPRVPGPPPNLPALLRALGVGSVVWYVAVVSAPFLALGARRLATHGGVRTTTWFVATIAGFFIVTAWVDWLVTYAGAAARPGFLTYLPVALRADLLPWIALLGVIAALESRRRAQLAALTEARLRAQVAEARLIALTGRLQPHFLFNTLQGISTLIHRDPQAADEMLVMLSDLLRDLLRHRDSVLIPLGEEVRHTRTYLDIARRRFSDRLTFAIDIDEALQQTAVPLFLLQPLVENALCHGVGVRASGGRVVITARRDATRLVLEVVDDGVGLASSSREGLGLRNTRERLRASYGDDHRLDVESPASGGTTVRLDLPYRIVDGHEPTP